MMKLIKKTIIDLDITDFSEKSLRNFLIESLSASGKVSIAKINTEFLSRSMEDEEFKKTLQAASACLVDGRGVLWTAKYLSLPVVSNKFVRALQAVWQMVYSGAAIVFYPRYITQPISNNIPGLEAFLTMIEAAVETRSGVFIFGGTQEDNDGAIRELRKKYPTLIISGTLNGYDFQEDSKVIPVEIINKTDAKLLIVALGSPLQENWIKDNLVKLKNIRVAVGEGGTLAYISGTFKRAPMFVQKIGLEWFWRLFANKSLTHQTGSRLKRVWRAVPLYIYRVVKYKIKNGAANEKA